MNHLVFSHTLESYNPPPPLKRWSKSLRILIFTVDFDRDLYGIFMNKRLCVLCCLWSDQWLLFGVGHPNGQSMAHWCWHVPEKIFLIVLKCLAWRYTWLVGKWSSCWALTVFSSDFSGKTCIQGHSKKLAVFLFIVLCSKPVCERYCWNKGSQSMVKSNDLRRTLPPSRSVWDTRRLIWTRAHLRTRFTSIIRNPCARKLMKNGR